MSRRAEWRTVLDAEVKKWSAMPYEELVPALSDHQRYRVEFDSKHYHVEVAVAEITERYLHVVVSVDDGSEPAARPLSHSFFCSTT